jgi:hypothetical protein
MMAAKFADLNSEVATKQEIRETLDEFVRMRLLPTTKRRANTRASPPARRADGS